MPRRACLALSLALLPLPALAKDGIFVWNDTQDLAVKMVTLNPDHPAEATALVVLQTIKTYSETMTAVASDGSAVGLCHQLQDGNESPASITGYDAKGREKWQVFPRDLHAALEAALPGGEKLASPPGWLTFRCINGGATGRAGELAFDIQISSGRPGPDGFVVSDTAQDRVMRLHLAGKTGKLLAVSLRDGGSLTLGRNPADRMRKVEGGVVFEPGAEFVFPENGEGRVMWGAEPIRWQGAAVVEGHDFAWWLPPRP